MQNIIDFWFSIGSTYSYVLVMRLRDVERSEGVHFNWRRCIVREIMIEQSNRPLVGKRVKTAYMWRDIEPRASLYGIPVQMPVPYPLREMELANRVATLAAKEGWCSDYVIATYRRWFHNGLEPGAEPNLSDSLREVGRNPLRIIGES